jgi:hypothetical protein
VATIKGAVTGESEPDDDSHDERRARLRGRRMGLGVVIVIAISFIAASSWQIASAVFGLGTIPISAGPGDSRERQCAEGIRRLARTLDAPLGADRPTPSTFESGWKGADPVEEACRGAAGGVDAWDALLRLRQAEEQLAEGDSDDLQPLRDEVAAHLPADLR